MVPVSFSLEYVSNATGVTKPTSHAMPVRYLTDIKKKENTNKKKQKRTPWSLVRKLTKPTECSPLVGELLWVGGCRVVRATAPHGR
jgi:hypothetical protein